METEALQTISDELSTLDGTQLLAGLAVISKDLARYLESNQRDDAAPFDRVYKDFSLMETASWGGSEFFAAAKDVGIPDEMAEQFNLGKFDLNQLRDPSIIHEWTILPGQRLLERFGREFKNTICGPGGPYELFNKNLVGQAELPVTIAATILKSGISMATLWYPSGVYWIVIG